MPLPLSQSKREARHLRSLLPGNMPAEKDKQGEGKRGAVLMNSRPQCYGNVQRLAWTCLGYIKCHSNQFFLKIRINVSLLFVVV